MDLASLEPLTSKLIEAGYRVVAFDLRGHGQTVYDQQPCTYEDAARDVLGLADHLGIGRFVFVGEGQGAVVALRTALLAPDRVRVLALIGPTADAALDGENDALVAAMDIWCTQGPTPEIFEPAAQRATASAQAATELMARWRASAWRDYRAAANALATRPRFVEQLPKITCPTLVVHSTRGIFVPMFLGKEVADNVSGPSRSVPIETGQHAITFAFDPRVAAEILTGLPGIEDRTE